MRAGGAFLPLDTKAPPERVGFLCQDSGCRHAVLHEEFRSALSDAADVTTMIVGPAHNDKWHGLAEQPEPARNSPQSDNLVYVIYTSGTTGKPKGVLIEHRHVQNYVLAYVRKAHTESLAVVAFNAAYFFDASIGDLYPPLVSGGSVLICENILSMPDTVSHFWGVASALATLPRVPCATTLVTQGGEAMSAAAIRNIKVDALPAGTAPPRIMNLYGPTECAVGCTYAWVEDEFVNIGHPEPNCQCHIVDPDTLRLQPVAVPGEMLIGGVQVGRGYLNRPDVTASKFIVYPWDERLGRVYRSGDLMKWLPCGELAFLGRIDFQVKLRGRRIELGEIESALSGQGRDVVVLLRSAEDFLDQEPRLVAYARPAWGDKGAAMQGARGQLPPYMLPSAMVDVPEWPFTAGGKLDRRRLPVPDAQQLQELLKSVQQDRNIEPPSDEVEQLIVSALAEVFGVEAAGISVCDDFFLDLGGSSLTLARIVRRLQNDVTSLTVTDLMGHPNARDLARLAKELQANASCQARLDLTEKWGKSMQSMRKRRRGSNCSSESMQSVFSAAPTDHNRLSLGDLTNNDNRIVRGALMWASVMLMLVPECALMWASVMLMLVPEIIGISLLVFSHVTIILLVIANVLHPAICVLLMVVVLAKKKKKKKKKKRTCLLKKKNNTKKKNK
eukprot:NODE_1424_length_2481_cov_3.740867.p1 GENE.NODE_1424_length_2481_cov_3.740867~~NODE_1424_length_2481_cov_3.740867.p1  ORF type:complete len:789 (+),score=157.65 NODE_1424_length_2481_cov_3.740867:356-2368(+)